MLNKILLKEGGVAQFVFAVFGSIVGLILLMASMEFYLDIKAVLNENKDLIKPDYLIVNKKVTALNTTGFGKSTFSDGDLADISSQKFVKTISPFISNGFEVKAFSDPGFNVPKIYTDMFFESLPDEFLDIPANVWHWSESDSIIPIAVPRDYLSLYNFGYALSKGMPQISGSMVSMVKFQLTMRSKDSTIVRTGQIVGFSDRINTILVPYNFLKYMNEKLKTEAPHPSRILIVARDPSDKSIPKYLESRNYETNKEKLKNSKLNILLNIMMSVLTGLSLVIILLSFWIFTLAFQLLITKKAEKIRTLLYLGFGVPQVIKYYVILFASANVLIYLLSAIVVNILKGKFYDVMISFNFPVRTGITGSVYWAGVAVIMIIVVVNSLFLYTKVSGMDNGKK